MNIDAVTLSMLASHSRAAAENMARTLFRTAHSAFVKETQDFTVMLLDARGATFAVPYELGATWYPGLSWHRVIDMVEDYRPGDVAFTNDPYAGFVATHAPDTHLWRPIIHEGQIVAFAAGHIHNTDMGGAVPASLSRSLTEIHQEGIRFTPTKLVREGVFDETILSVMANNVRKPELNIGDIKALVGALATGERKVRAMLAKFGVDGFRTGIAALQDTAEKQARTVLSSIPDGRYEFCDYADEDGENGDPVRLHVVMTIAGDEATLDFSGSDPQLASSLNVPTGGDPRHTLFLVGVYYVLATLYPKLLLNVGLTRPFTCIAPEGSVLNPRFPAAVGMRSLTCARLRSVIFGAFAAALPERLPAAPAGNNTIVNVMTWGEARGRRVIAAVNPVVGGGGGMPHRDGTNGSGADAAYLRNTPLELTEAEVPIRFVRYGLAIDTGGAGRWRGGLATEMAFRVSAPDTRITARNRDRSKFRPWGLLGGRAGGLADMSVTSSAGEAVDLGNADIAVLAPGDVLSIRSAGGGGRGDPFEREPWRVALDVARGYVSTEGARRDYGVVLSEGVVDEEATSVLRRVTGAPSLYGFGAEREVVEAAWSPADYDALAAIYAALPVHWRFFVKRQVFKMRRERGGLVFEAFARVRERYPDIPDVGAAVAQEPRV